VLQGAAVTLSRVPRPTWMVEIILNEFQLPKLNPNYARTFDLFWQHNYQAHTADGQNRLIQADDVEGWVKAGRCKSGTINYIFTPAGFQP